jgi:hypothetical protein
MMNTLHCDVCVIDDPTKFNSEIVDIDERLNKYLGEHLWYACVHWGQHLEDVVDQCGNVYRLAKGFFFSHLLHWIEVMSLLNETFHIFVSLNQTKSCLQVRSVLQNLASMFYSLLSQKHTSCKDDIYWLINDAFNLMQRFRKPIEQSADHVYVSAIPFISPHSILFNTYAPNLENIPRPIYGDATSVSWVVLQLEGFHVTGFLLECSRFVYAKEGSTKLEIWDVETGTPYTYHLLDMVPQFAASSSHKMERNFCPKMKPIVSSSGMLSVSMLLECQYSCYRLTGYVDFARIK